LRRYVTQRPATLASKHVFLLRNLARGRGVSLFNAPTHESFFPDFILWVVSGRGQSIAFVDPHGLLWARSLAHPKIAVHRELAKLEVELRRRATDHAPTICKLTSYIVSVTPYASLRKAFGFKVNSAEDFERE